MKKQIPMKSAVAMMAMCVGMSGSARAELTLVEGTTNSYDDPAAWSGGVVDGVVTGTVTAAGTVLEMAHDVVAPKGMMVGVEGAFAPALRVKSAGEGATRVTMGGPLVVSASNNHQGDDARIAFGGGGRSTGDAVWNVDFDWGDAPAEIDLYGNMRVDFSNILGKGLRLTGHHVLGGHGSRCSAIVYGGVNLGGGEIWCDDALLSYIAWPNAAMGAVAGGTGLQGGTPSRIVLKNRGGFATFMNNGASYKDLAVELVQGGFVETRLEPKRTFASLSIPAGFGNLLLARDAETEHFSQVPGSLLGISRSQRSTTYTLKVPSEDVRVIGGTATEGAQQNVVHGVMSMQCYYGFANEPILSWGSAHRNLMMPNGFSTYRDGAIAFLEPNGFSDDWTNASVLDNMKMTAATTLSRDTEINALSLQNSAGLNLGGHTLSIQSGMIYAPLNMEPSISNGTILIEDVPLMIAVNRPFDLGAGIATTNTDPEKTVFAFYGAGGDYVYSRCILGGDNSAATGRFFFSRMMYEANSLWIPNDKALSPGMTLDTNRGTSILLSAWDGDYRVGAMSGAFTLAHTNQNGLAYRNSLCIGDAGDYELDINRPLVRVCTGGYLAPGALYEDGKREGTMTFVGNQHVKTFVFEPGSELRVCVQPNGEASKLALTGFTNGVQLGGKIAIASAESATPGTTWTVLESDCPITGKFDDGTIGYSAYVVHRDDGSYAVEVSKTLDATIIYFR